MRFTDQTLLGLIVKLDPPPIRFIRKSANSTYALMVLDCFQGFLHILFVDFLGVLTLLRSLFLDFSCVPLEGILSIGHYQYNGRFLAIALIFWLRISVLLIISTKHLGIRGGLPRTICIMMLKVSGRLYHVETISPQGDVIHQCFLLIMDLPFCFIFGLIIQDLGNALALTLSVDLPQTLGFP